MAFHVMVRKVLMEGGFKWVSRTPCRQRDSKANQKCGISDMSHKFPLITRQKHGVRETHLKPLPYAVSDMQLSHIVANQTICKIREVSNFSKGASLFSPLDSVYTEDAAKTAKTPPRNNQTSILNP